MSTTARSSAPSPTRSPTPGCRAAPPAPHRRRPGRREAGRAPGRDALRPLGRVHDPLLRLLLRVRRSATTPTSIGGLGASNVALGGLPRPGPAVHRRRRHPVGPQADGRPRDHRDAPPLGVLRRGPRGGARGVQHRRQRVRHRPPPADPQLAARRDGCARPAGRRSSCATSARCRATSSRTRSGGRACGSSRTSPAPRSSPTDMEIGQLVNAEPGVFYEDDPDGEPLFEGTELLQAKAKAAIDHRPDAARRHHARAGAGRTGASTASCATPRSAPTSGARSPCGSSRRTTCSAPATSRRSTWPTTARSSSDPPPVRCPSCPSCVDGEGYLVAQSDFTEPVGPSYWERG